MNKSEIAERAARERFESWAKSLWPNIAIFTCNICERVPHYEDGLTQKLWEAYQAGERAIAESQAWISVKEKLPPEGETVLTYEEGTVSTNWIPFVNSVPSHLRERFSSGHDYVSHWMPLPDPPMGSHKGPNKTELGDGELSPECPSCGSTVPKVRWYVLPGGKAAPPDMVFTEENSALCKNSWHESGAAQEVSSPSPASVGHVVGEGGKCWCGETHQHWCDQRERAEKAEGDTRELKAALQAIVNWCRHPAHGGRYDLPKPLEPYLLQAEKVLGSD